MTLNSVEPLHLMQPDRRVGIVGYGGYVPRYRLPGSEVARIWTNGLGGSPVKEKAVAGLDEDVVTMSIEAARNALARAQIDPRAIRAVWVGSESHPYAVKPTSTIVAESIGTTPSIQAADGNCLQSYYGSGWRLWYRWRQDEFIPHQCHGHCSGRPVTIEYGGFWWRGFRMVGWRGCGSLPGGYSLCRHTRPWRRQDQSYPATEIFTGEPAISIIRSAAQISWK
jgi:hypothetical protein